MDWLPKISITCFAASYLIVLGLEISRLFFQAKLRTVMRIALAAAGLFAHTVFIAYHTRSTVSADGIWLGSWLGWGLAAAWILAAVYLWMSVTKPLSTIGIFLLPVTLVVIGVSTTMADSHPFSPARAKTVWNLIHGASLLLGTVTVALGFVFGVMYLIQARQLKRKTFNSVRLPSLEWLQMWAERSLMVSTVLLGCGLLSGIALEFVKRSGNDAVASPVSWTDPVIWSSGILFIWLLVTTILGVLYQPVRQGRKIAWLVTISFLFLLLEFVIIWQFGHGTADSGTAGTDQVLKRAVHSEVDVADLSKANCSAIDQMSIAQMLIAQSSIAGRIGGQR